jgi:hypothetical protein
MVHADRTGSEKESRMSRPIGEQGNDALEEVSLWGSCGEFSLPGTLWVVLLNLAQLYGWKPAGTAPPDPAVFEIGAVDLPVEQCLGPDGSYYPSQCQVMTRGRVPRDVEKRSALSRDRGRRPTVTENGARAGYRRSTSRETVALRGNARCVMRPPTAADAGRRQVSASRRSGEA